MKQATLAIILGLVIFAAIQNATAAATSLGTFNPGDTVTLSAGAYNANYVYTWSITNTAATSIPATAPSGDGKWTWKVPDTPAPTTYNVQLIVSQKSLGTCMSAATFTITVNAPTTCTITSDPATTEVCVDSSDAIKYTYTNAALKSSDKVDWTITDPSGKVVKDAQGTTYTIKWSDITGGASGTSGTYIVSASSSSCKQTMTITVDPVPVIGTITASA
jgi:hypothetical protein